MTTDLLSKFEKYCKEKSLIRKGEGIIVAVSGGVDSVVLLDLLSKLRSKYALRLQVAHFNHQLRGKESEGDEAFVHRLAEKRGLPFVVERMATAAHAKRQRVSIQVAARDLRYSFLSRVSKEEGTYKIATAHNANDNAETLLFNLCRGAGISGLSGIPVFRPDLNIIRPLLFASRSKIETYAKAHGLKFRNDSSNRKLHYKRNFIRKKVLPLLERSLNPEIVSALNRTAEIFRRLEDMVHHEARIHLERLTIRKTKDRLQLNLPEFRKLHPFLQETIIELVARIFTGVPLESNKVSRILGLLQAEVGKHIATSKHLSVYRDRQQLVFTSGAKRPGVEYEIRPNRSYTFGDFRFSSKTVPRKAVRWTNNRNVEYVDADRLNNRLVLRTWKKGDWFKPLGLRGKKKLSDFLIDEKIPLYEKESIPVLESHGNIVWVCGVRLDDRCRITDSTRNVLKLEIENKEA